MICVKRRCEAFIDACELHIVGHGRDVRMQPLDRPAPLQALWNRKQLGAMHRAFVLTLIDALKVDDVDRNVDALKQRKQQPTPGVPLPSKPPVLPPKKVLPKPDDVTDLSPSEIEQSTAQKVSDGIEQQTVAEKAAPAVVSSHTDVKKAYGFIPKYPDPAKDDDKSQSEKSLDDEFDALVANSDSLFDDSGDDVGVESDAELFFFSFDNENEQVQSSEVDIDEDEFGALMADVDALSSDLDA